MIRKSYAYSLFAQSMASRVVRKGDGMRAGDCSLTLNQLTLHVACQCRDVLTRTVCAVGSNQFSKHFGGDDKKFAVRFIGPTNRRRRESRRCRWEIVHARAPQAEQPGQANNRQSSCVIYHCVPLCPFDLPNAGAKALISAAVRPIVARNSFGINHFCLDVRPEMKLPSEPAVRSAVFWVIRFGCTSRFLPRPQTLRWCRGLPGASLTRRLSAIAL